jgi:hypothetical protein
MDALTSYFTDKKKEDEVQVIPNCWFMDGFVALFFFNPSLEHQSFFFFKSTSLFEGSGFFYAMSTKDDRKSGKTVDASFFGSGFLCVVEIREWL